MPRDALMCVNYSVFGRIEKAGLLACARDLRAIGRLAQRVTLRLLLADQVASEVPRVDRLFVFFDNSVGGVVRARRGRVGRLRRFDLLLVGLLDELGHFALGLVQHERHVLRDRVSLRLLHEQADENVADDVADAGCLNRDDFVGLIKDACHHEGSDPVD